MCAPFLLQLKKHSLAKNNNWALVLAGEWRLRRLSVTAARRALYTGHIGDGKIFVYGVAEAVKVRTGEHGYDAVQSIDALS